MAQTATATLPGAAPVEWRPNYNPWIIALVVTMATFMEVLDTSIANVALPHIAGGLSASQDESTWVLTSYLVSNAIVLPISGWLSDTIGRKRFYMTCVALFTISSFLCGFAPNLGVLIFCRILQGIGGGGLAPSEQAILADTFTPAQRGVAFSVYGMAVVLAPAIGPTLGGWITDNYSWRWIFYINVPVGFISLFLSQRILQDPPYLLEKAKRGFKKRIDYVGLLLIMFGLGALQIVFDKGQEEDWFASRFILSFTIAAVMLLVTFVFWELKHDDPIVDVRLLKKRNFATACFFMFVLGAVLFGTTVLIPQFLQTLMGYSAQQAGMALSPGAIALMFMMPIAGRLVSKVDARYMMAFGFLATSLALFHMTNLTLTMDFRTAVFMRLFQVIGLAFVFIPNNTLAYAGIPREKNNQVSGMINLARNVGGSIGISAMLTFVSRLAQTHQSNLTERTTMLNPAFQQLLNGLRQRMMAAGMDYQTATQRAYATIGGMIGAQSATLAYVNVIWIMAVVTLCLIPFVFLMRRNKPGGAAPAGH